MEAVQIALEIMGLGMVGIFTAMLVIMIVTTILKKMVRNSGQYILTLVIQKLSMVRLHLQLLILILILIKQDD